MTPAPADLFYRFDGPSDAPVFVLSHSLGLSTVMWDPVLPQLVKRFRVLRYDHRGHGASPAPAGPYEIADFGRDFVQLLDRLQVERVSFCGLSLGGMVGQWLGAHAPDRLDRLVLCCTAERMLKPEDFTTRAAAVRAGGMAPIVDLAISRWFTPGFLAGHSSAIAPLRAALLAVNVEGYAATCDAIAAMDQRDDLPKIKAPTLVLAGSADVVTPPAQAQQMADRIPGARSVVLAGAPHIACVEQPEAFADQVLGWMALPTS
ncbi:MAG TPA: 3-oxoadipate enol-lactonase [Candidatus Dormibacteraeota bacterium]|jgi:3-oxoadipate enol-lactonase